MTRRRLGLAAALAVVALGAAWWLLSDGLTAEERQLVGTWLLWDESGDLWNPLMILGPDRQGRAGFYRVDRDDGKPPYRWSVRGGEIVFDDEPTALRRCLRPVAPLIGVAVGPVSRGRLEIVSPNELRISYPNGIRKRWDRVTDGYPAKFGAPPSDNP